MAIHIHNSIPPEKVLDYKIIKKDLENVIDTYINKIEREFPLRNIRYGKELFAGFIKVAKNTYKTIIFLGADKPQNYFRKREYIFATLPLIRTILEEVYTVAFMSENLPSKIMWFHKAGWREMKEEYDRFVIHHGKDPSLSSWLDNLRKLINEGKHDLKVTESEIKNIKKAIKRWPLPSRMKSEKNISKDLIDYFETLDTWFYGPLSQSTHLTWGGLSQIEVYISLQGEDDRIDTYIEKIRSICLFRAITMVLALLSEVENILHFQFKQKLGYLWGIIIEYFEDAKILYDKRYRRLLTV